MPDTPPPVDRSHEWLSPAELDAEARHWERAADAAFDQAGAVTGDKRLALADRQGFLLMHAARYRECAGWGRKVHKQEVSALCLPDNA